jgi:hypothetical protein
MVAGAPQRRPRTPRNGLYDMTFYLRASALLLIAVAMSLGLPAAGSRQSSEQTQFVAPVMMNLPDYLRPVTDPAFGTIFTRITKPGVLGNGVACGNKYRVLKPGIQTRAFSSSPMAVAVACAFSTGTHMPRCSAALDRLNANGTLKTPI